MLYSALLKSMPPEIVYATALLYLLIALLCLLIPISAESWIKHLQSHFVQPQESVPDMLPGRSNLPTWHQLLSDQLRSGQVSPSDIAVPPGPGGR